MNALRYVEALICVARRYADYARATTSYRERVPRLIMHTYCLPWLRVGGVRLLLSFHSGAYNIDRIDLNREASIACSFTIRPASLALVR